MIEEATITFYRVFKCGYYENQGANGHRFGDLATVMQQLQAWAAPLTLGQRKTFDPVDEEFEGTYLLDIQGAGDLWVLTMWNELLTADGAVAAIRDDSRLGAAEVVETEIEEGTIPGYASYFMVIPSRNYIAGVRFDRRAYGQLAFRHFVESFMSSRSPFAVTRTAQVAGELDIEVLGYSRRPTDPPSALTPLFRTGVHNLPGQLDDIRAHVTSIARVATKAKLDFRSQERMDFFKGLLTQVGLRERQNPVQPVKIRYHVDVNLSLDELNRIIDTWRENGNRGGASDIGFAYSGDLQKFHWLSKSICRTTVGLDVERANAEVVDAASLFGQLTTHMQHILRDAGA